MTTSSDNNLKGFYDYTDEDLRQTLPKGTYHLRVREAEVGEWDDGRVRLDISTEVVSGEHVGKFGPRITWSEPKDYDGETADGRGFHISAEDGRKQIVRDSRAIRDGRDLVLSNPTSFDERMLREIGHQITNDEFVANISEDKNGYARAGKLYPMSAPPKTFKGNEAVTMFSLDEI